MRVFLSLFLLALLAPTSFGGAKKPIVISVIDTGFTPIDGMPKPNFCKFGHADLTSENVNLNKIPPDNSGHGTHIVYTIASQLGSADKSDYCLVLIKYWTPKMPNEKAVQNSTQAFQRSLNMHVDVINYSSYGTVGNEEEKRIIRHSLNLGIKIISAAGNGAAQIVQGRWFRMADLYDILKRRQIDFTKRMAECFPGNYDDRIIVVGNLTKDGTKIAPSSNYGDRVNVWEIGSEINQGGVKMTGTSQATAVHTGKVVKEMINERKKNGTKTIAYRTK